MDQLFIFGQIVAVIALCCGAVLSIFAAGTVASSPENSPRNRAD